MLDRYSGCELYSQPFFTFIKLFYCVFSEFNKIIYAQNFMMNLTTPSYIDLLFPNTPKGCDLYYQNLHADGSSDEILIKWKPFCNYTCSLFNENHSIIRNLLGHLKISQTVAAVSCFKYFSFMRGPSSLPPKCVTAKGNFSFN